MSALTDAYLAKVETVNNQLARLTAGAQEADMWSGPRSERFRADPHREPEPMLKAVLEYLRPEDVVLDVGGGGGRFGLPMALRCAELINVDPSAGMKRVFDETVSEAGIKNARFIQSDWQSAEGIRGDVSFVSNVTYFVPDIASFIAKLQAASRRRVVISMTVDPPPNGGGELFQVLYGETMALLPGYRELLPVLWEMGIVPEVRLFAPLSLALALRVFATREEAVEASLTTNWLAAGHRERAREAFTRSFDSLYKAVEGGFQRRQVSDARQMLVTWET